MRLAHMLDVPAHVELAFDEGTPVAVNGIAMSLQELCEILATIAADHGILSPVRPVDAAPRSLGEGVVAEALAALGAVSDRGGSGIVAIRLHDGAHTIVSVRPTALVQPA